MKRNRVFVLLAVLLAAAPLAVAFAQGSSPATEAKKETTLKIQVVFDEYDGQKKIASLPYVFHVITDDRYVANGRVSIRDGVQVPTASGKEGAINYMTIGTNMDSSATTTPENGAFKLYLSVERSWLYTPDEMKPAMDINHAATGVGGNPFIQAFHSTFNLLIRDGQSIEAASAANPLNGRVLKVVVTANIEK
jgi:hypothetical protein